MPEGPEVRRHADLLARALCSKPLVALSARTKAARAWLEAHPDTLPGRTVQTVGSRGKNLVGTIDGGFYFYSHLMMWGRWHVFHDPAETLERDRRERARIVVPDAVALLFSAPVFEVGMGDPFAQIPHLAALGPDCLPVGGAARFDAHLFCAHLSQHAERTIGAVLLDQTVVAGLGNYLRAEILFQCQINPWRLTGELSAVELHCLSDAVPTVAARAYATEGTTVSDEWQTRMRTEPGLTYNPDSDWGTRHAVFRRTNLPCLACGTPIRQLRQVTRHDDDGDKERIIYFCPQCQNVPVPDKPRRVRKPL